MPALFTSVSMRPKRARPSSTMRCGDGEHVGIGRRLDRTGVGDHAVIAVAKGLDQAGTDTLRGAGDDDGLA
jgi:hypothetical protein